MQITLIQNEIEEALQDYLKKTMTIPSNKKFEIEFQSTRGTNGIMATINIVSSGSIKTDASAPVAKVTVERNTLEETPKKKSFFSNIE